MKSKKAKRIRPIDGIDREILRRLKANKRPLTGRQIALGVGRTPPAIRPRLDNLQRMGIVKPIKIAKNRVFNRTFKSKKSTRIVAPRSITWGIDWKKNKKK